MSSMEDVFKAACKAREIPGAVLVATDKAGDAMNDFLYPNNSP